MMGDLYWPQNITLMLPSMQLHLLHATGCLDASVAIASPNKILEEALVTPSMTADRVERRDKLPASKILEEGLILARNQGRHLFDLGWCHCTKK